MNSFDRHDCIPPHVDDDSEQLWAYIFYLQRVIADHGGCENLLTFEQFNTLTSCGAAE